MLRIIMYNLLSKMLFQPLFQVTIRPLWSVNIKIKIIDHFRFLFRLFYISKYFYLEKIRVSIEGMRISALPIRQ